MIRDLTLKDLPEVDRSFEDTDFEGFKSVGLNVDRKGVLQSIAHAIQDSSTIVLGGWIEGSLESMIVVLVQRNFFDLTQLKASVIMWNVTNIARCTMMPVRLWRKVEDRCRKIGCEMMESAYVPGHSPEALQGIYDRMDMKQVESIYRKELS